MSYLAVSAESGFVRVKQYDSGKIDAGLLGLNKSKKTFTRVLETYEDGGKTFIVSEYSNDGNLQAYVTKLKNASVTLNEDHI